jgi:hypothetical protein
MTINKPTNGNEQPPSQDSLDISFLYTASGGVIDAMKTGNNEQGYEIARSMINNPTVPIHFQAWFHLILSSNLMSGTASHHAEVSVGLFNIIKQKMGEEEFSKSRISNIARIAEGSLIKSKEFEKEHKINFELVSKSNADSSGRADDPFNEPHPFIIPADDEEISQLLFEFVL